MSASSAQQTVEKKESVKDVKPMKPPIKPKPIVPPKPKQAFISTNSDIKSPSLSPNSGGPCSPSFDIPSAFKISQLTGPQPYGARRTSLRRWSSSVGEEVLPESNTLLSPGENVVPEFSTKVTTQSLAAPVKSFQTGSVWKGKSPFMLTTRGWGEQRSQVKDFHESESFSQKHSFSSTSNDADLKEKEMVLEGNMVINSGSHSTSESQVDHEGVNTNVEDLKQSLSRASEEVEKTVFGVMSSGKLQKLEMPAKDYEVKESSSQLSCSPQTDFYFGTTKQYTQYEHNKQDSKTEGFSYKSDQKTTGSLENIDVASIEVKNASLRTKDYGEPQLISLVPTTMPKADILFTENTKNSETIEKSPLSDTSSSTVYRYHEDRSKDIPELRTVMREEQEADSGYLEAPQTEIMVTNQNTEQSSLAKQQQDEQVEKHDISSVTQIAAKPATENKMYTNIPHEDKESTVSMEHNILSTAEHYDLHEGKFQVASDNNKTPYSDQEDKEIVAPTDMQSPICTVRPYEFFSDESEKTSTHIREYNIEEEQDQLKNRIHEYDDTTQTRESIFGNNARSTHESETPSAPELPGHADNEASANLYVGSQIIENIRLVPEEVYSHSVDESEESLHSYIERETQSSKPHEELSQSENYKSSRPELNYDESQLRYSEATSQDPAARVTKPENLSDPYKESDRLVNTTAQSPILKEYEVHLDKIEHRYDESNNLQYIHSQSQEQECNHGHKVELDDKQLDKSVHTYEQSKEPEYIYQQLEKSVCKFEMPDKPSVLYEQLEEPVELSEEPVYTYDEQSQDRVSTYKQSEGSGLKYEQAEELGYRPQKVEHSIHKHELLEEPSYRCEKSEETVHGDDLSEESVHENKQAVKPACRYEQTEQLALQQPMTIVHNNQSEEPEEAEEAVQKYGQLKDPLNKYEPSEESEHRYAYLEDTVHKYEQLEDPVHKYEQLNESTGKYEQTEQHVQRYQKSEESTHKYEMSEEPVNRYSQSEEINHSHDQSLELDYRSKQHDEPAHSYELANQNEGIEDPAYIHTGSDATNSEHTQSGLIDLESHQQRYKLVQLEEMDSTTNMPTVSSEVLVKFSEKDIRPSEYLEQQLIESYMEEPKYSNTSTDEMHANEKTEEQFHKSPLSEEQQLLGIHKEETQQWHAKSEETQHVDGLSEGSRQRLPVITTVESDGSMPEKTQDQDGQITYQILNGHAEHGELQPVDYASEAVNKIQAEEPEETQAEEAPAENFDFLEGTVVLDSSFMRGKASLGKKRGHRTPAETCASGEDPEYWMFRDSTEPKNFPERNSDEEDKAEKSPGGTPDETPDNSPSPVKSPNKKGIFGGIISPSLLKGRLKTRSKTTEDDTVRPEAEESKSPGKEKPESSSHSMNWLQALKKKRKSTKETNKEEKKKQPK
ncbi:182 kDa tankyrase-1-binding protein isoform X2 [Lithobates pipiens]